ncbi:Nectin-4 [Schistosoma japonicum]|uniref:Nectin-4 n=1 Tax=Schistosoma japonicum TaxID=6182 RepID=A0A4Z2CKA9_SCHJA|nr:Nectin-4 [Schistosoma japonicum]
MDSELGLGDQCGQELCMGRGRLVQQREKRGLEESWIKGSSRSSSSRLPTPVLAEASVRGLEDQNLWQVGREGATLKCLSEGQPPPNTTGHGKGLCLEEGGPSVLASQGQDELVVSKDHIF